MSNDGLSPDHVSLHLLITAMIRQGNHDRAVRLLQEMVSHSSPTDASNPNPFMGNMPLGGFFYARVMAAFSRAHQSEYVLQVWDLLNQNGVKPDPRCHFYHIDALSTLGRYEECLLLLPALPEEVKLAAYSSVIKSLAAVGDVDQALALLHQLKEDGHHNLAAPLTAALNAAVKAGKIEAALPLAERLLNEKGDMRPDVVFYGAVIDAFAKAGMWEKALGLLERMEEAPNAFAFASAAEACARAGKW